MQFFILWVENKQTATVQQSKEFYIFLLYEIITVNKNGIEDPSLVYRCHLQTRLLSVDLPLLSIVALEYRLLISFPQRTICIHMTMANRMIDNQAAIFQNRPLSSNQHKIKRNPVYLQFRRKKPLHNFVNVILQLPICTCSKHLACRTRGRLTGQSSKHQLPRNTNSNGPRAPIF